MQSFAQPRPTLSLNMDTVKRAVRFAMTELKLETLKDKQKEVICSFVNGHDCFVILHTVNSMLCYVAIRF